MAENDQQAQESTTASDTAQESTSQRSQASNTTSDNEPRVPEHRFDEVNKRMKDAENALKQLQQEREEQAEAKAQEQGQHKELADKRQKKIEKLESELKQVKSQWTEERRRNTWNNAAQGIIRSNAIGDAFMFLSEDELSGLDEGDEEGYKQLAQNLVEVRDYLAAEGARGAGSGGSR